MINYITIKIINIHNHNKFELLNDTNNLNIIINIYNLNNYKIFSWIQKINNIISIYNNIKTIYIIFDENIKTELIHNKILTKLNDVLYKYEIDFFNYIKIINTGDISVNLMYELFLYKDITMKPNKTPKTYVEYILSRIPKKYQYKIFDINKITNSNLTFPLTKAVGAGSMHDSYFIHIFPQNQLENKFTIYLIGKSVTFDSGGYNLKSERSNIHDMNKDMIGSGILISVLNLIESTNINIHILLPVVENSIGSTASIPGSIVKSMSGKTVEIINTDAEGRLCIVDALDYIQLELAPKYDNCLILDIATLTGNVETITTYVSSIGLNNKRGKKYLNLLIKIGEHIGEYIDTIKLRKDYLDLLTCTHVADIKNINTSFSCDCILAGAFMNYFIYHKIPWVHLDIASVSVKDGCVLSYGVNLLYQFIKILI
uniref:Cytosol aminopeptidase domain-containing protein n=1 Tax=viral metagenome TaxID=1070528 RepID=A0A6C0H7P9_9ZZZZ